MKKDDESGEFDYYKSNPSPLKDAVFECIAEGCTLVMPYHGTVFHKATYDDARSIREGKSLPTYCPKHQKLYDYLVEEQRRKKLEEEGEG